MACPFCGFQPKAGHITAGKFWALHLHHQSKIKCPLEGFVIEGEEGFMQWNTRSIERELQAQVVERDRLRACLEKLRTEICTNPAITDIFWIGDPIAGISAIDLITVSLEDDWDYSEFCNKQSINKAGE